MVDVVVEGEDRTGKVEGWVQDVRKVCGERGIGVCWGGDGDPISFAQVGRVKLFLLVEALVSLG